MVLLAKILWCCFCHDERHGIGNNYTFGCSLPKRTRQGLVCSQTQWKSQQRLNSAQRGRGVTDTVQHYICKLANIILQPRGFAFNYSYRALFLSAFLPSLP